MSRNSDKYAVKPECDVPAEDTDYNLEHLPDGPDGLNTIQNELRLLTETIDELESVIELLHRRLGPVLHSDLSGRTLELIPPVSYSPMTGNLQWKRVRLDGIKETVVDIIGNLEI